MKTPVSLARITILIMAVAIILAAVVAITAMSSNDAPSQSNQNNITPRSSPRPATYVPPTLQSLNPTIAPFTRIGQALPSILLQNLDGETFSFSDYEGQILVINFWAVWCPPCVREMPTLQEFHETSGDDVAILAVTDPANGQSMSEVLDFLDENNLDRLPIGLDQHMALHSRLAIQQMPTTVFVDENGIIRQEHSGEMTTDTLFELVDEVRNMQQ